MYNSLQLAIKYIHYYISASNGRGHGIHSPFVFDFIEKILNDHRHFYVYDRVEALRQRMLNDKRILEVQDYGAGSSKTSSNKRSVSSIARNAVKSPKYGQFLFRLVNHYQPRRILELGTSLGISTSYLALGNPAAKVVTVEGSREIASIAEENFKDLGISSIQQVLGNFDESLPFLLQSGQSFDLVFIDGNHRKEPTLNYFKLLLKNLHNETILIFDDIHWSREMEGAWKEICSNENVRVSIDLFFLGIVIFRESIREKQHYQVRF